MRAPPPASRSSPASRSPPCATRLDVHVLGYFIDPRRARPARFLAEQRQRRIDRVGRMVAQLETARHAASTPTRSCSRPSISPGKSIGRPGDRPRARRRRPRQDDQRGVRPVAVARPARIRRPRGRAAADRSSRRFTPPAASRRWRIPGCCAATSGSPASPRRASTRSRRITRTTTRRSGALPLHGRSPRARRLRRLRLPRRRIARRAASRQRRRCRPTPSISCASAPRAAPRRRAPRLPRRTAGRNRRTARRSSPGSSR